MPVNNTALITGIGGQDGGYLTERLLGDGWRVHGLNWSTPSYVARAPHIAGTQQHTLDVGDLSTVGTLIDEIKPTHVFHLAAVSSVGLSWQEPTYTAQLNAMCSIALFEACLRLQQSSGRQVRVVNAASGEIFAGAGQSPQTENTPIVPTSPYGVTKAFGYEMARTLRSDGLWASNAILYNHESPRRSETFVSRKVTMGVAAIARGRAQSLSLGYLDGERDWGWAPDVVDALYRMATHEEPDDFIVATGESHTVREFVAEAFNAAGIADWERHVVTDDNMIRPAEPARMIGDSSKARRILGWLPTMSFEEVVAAMVNHDLHC